MTAVGCSLPSAPGGCLAVGLTLGADFARGYPIVSFIAACAIAGILYFLWVRAGRPRGVAQAERVAELDLEDSRPDESNSA